MAGHWSLSSAKNRVSVYVGLSQAYEHEASNVSVLLGPESNQGLLDKVFSVLKPYQAELLLALQPAR